LYKNSIVDLHYQFIRKLNKQMDRLVAALKAEEETIVDVRTPMEFMGGHVAGSINIPLIEVLDRIDEFRGKTNLVLCCASGGRSGQATAFLQQHGIECTNGGGWTTVNFLLNQ
jgi:rhodanese-related sulfurtransferase